MTHCRSVVLAFVLASALAAAPRQLVFSCLRTNDLYQATGAKHPRFDTPARAIGSARSGGAVLILAGQYPATQTALSADVFELARKKNLRLYVEYPSYLPQLTTGAPTTAAWNRGVVASDAFGPSLARLRILGLHEAHFVPVDSTVTSHIVLARVAGFDTAVYGLPPKDVHPILFQHPAGNILVATTSLSQFVTGRYAPSEAWPQIWTWILKWLVDDEAAPKITTEPTVHPTYTRNRALPRNAERTAFRRGVAWFTNARLLMHPSWTDRFEPPAKHKDADGVLPAAPRGTPIGDGSHGILEGLNSRIAPDGTQPVRWWLRSDCIGEVSGAFGISCALDRKSEHCRIAERLNEFLFNSDLGGGPRNHPASSSYGLLGWSLPLYTYVYYGDDNARAILGSMLAAASTHSTKWDDRILRTILANFRTTGRYGFRRDRIEEKPLQENGWRSFFESERLNYAPHYESYMWALYLWAYGKTGYKPFLDRATSAIRRTVDAYPDQWRWTNGIQQERARMLLPLSWLIRVQDTPEHRAWLARIAGDLLAAQDASGAIREEIGSAGRGQYNPPKSNEAYGTSEAPLIQANGDPLTDLLYTSNFAFLGLHEAAAATGDARYKKAETKLAQYLCRIQAKSRRLPEVDGAWFRAFDFRRWDYWASNADAGWGAWSVETGWTQAWVTSILGLRELSASVWDITKSSQVARHAPSLLQTMLPDGR